MAVPAKWLRILSLVLPVLAAVSAKDINATTVTNGEAFLELIMKYVLDDYVKLASLLQDRLSLKNETDDFTPRCLAEMRLTLERIKTGDEWAMNVLDSFGKPPSGIERGNRVWLGAFDQCRTSKNVDWLGGSKIRVSDFQYALVMLGLRGIQDKGLMNVKVGICVPRSCTKVDISQLVSTAMLAFEGKSASENVTYSVLNTWYSPEIIPLTIGGYVMCFILFMIAVFIIIGTIWDLVLQRREKGKCKKENGVRPGLEMTDQSPDKAGPNGTGNIEADGKDNGNYQAAPKPSHNTCVRLLLAFSLYTNGKKLLNTKQAEGTLTCLHGIRFISMLWIIQGHTLFWLHTQDTWANRNEAYAKASTPVYALLLSGEFGVDTFFLLSGTLVAYLALPEMTRLGGHRKMKWCYYYFHRWWRLTPTLWLILFSYLFLFPVFYNGPTWAGYPGGPDFWCFPNIWSTLLYLVNYYPGCMGWTWYLACDFQFYCILGPIALCCFHRSWKLGLGCVVTCVVWQTGGTIAINFIVGYNAMTFEGDDPSYFQGGYRVADYAIGFGLGYLLRKYQKQRFVISPGKQALAWIIVIIFLPPNLISWDSMPVLVGPHGSVIASAVYLGLKRWCWVLGVAWIIFACCTGYGGFINTFLSWSAFVPLSRLTYCAYLLHPILMYVYEMGRRQVFQATDISIHYLITGHLVTTYIISFFVSLALESPMIGLEKVFMTRQGQGSCCCGRKDRQELTDPETGATGVTPPAVGANAAVYNPGYTPSEMDAMAFHKS